MGRFNEDRIDPDTIHSAVAETLESVFLTCIVCGNVREIHVNRERDLPKKVYWECLSCQKRDLEKVK